MENKLKSVLSGTGFYVLLAVCLIAAAAAGYFLLFAGDEEPLPVSAQLLHHLRSRPAVPVAHSNTSFPVFSSISRSLSAFWGKPVGG